jgi:hypothetical protein
MLFNCSSIGIQLVIVPIESHASMGLGERLHGPLRRIVQKLQLEIPTADAGLRLSTAVEALNDTIGVNGLIPSLLIFGCLPRLSLKPEGADFPTQKVRLALMQSARVHAERIICRNCVEEAERHNAPTSECNLQPGDILLVWREKKSWQGPLVFIERKGNPMWILDGTRDRSFSSTHVKAFSVPAGDPDIAASVASGAIVENEQELPLQPSNNPPLAQADNADALFASSDAFEDSEANYTPCHASKPVTILRDVMKSFGSPSNVFAARIIANRSREAQLPEVQNAKLKELEGLFDRHTFALVEDSELPNDANLMGSRFVLSVKDQDGRAAYEARLVIQGHRDTQKDCIVAEAPMVSRLAVRTLISVSVIFSFRLRVIDIKQAYLQSSSKL